MSFRETYLESRARYLAAYNGEQADRYDNWVKRLTREDHLACLADLQTCVEFNDGMAVLDAGAGTGALCLSLTLIPGLTITALEPCEAMLASLRSKPELKNVTTVSGFCDHSSDNSLFDAATFG
jgi:ubiquinone/menaquinone biosynthesis C-methylase UbiE